MGQLTAFRIPSVTQLAGEQQAPVPEPPPEVRERTRQVAGAVHYLNSVDYAGEGREITFSLDRVTKLPVVRVIDTNTREVIQQWPRDYVLQVAALQEKGKAG